MASFNLLLKEPYEKAFKTSKGEKKVISKKETRLILCVTHDRKNRVKITTEHLIKPVQWDFKKQRVKSQVNGSAPLNDLLDKLIPDAKKEYNRIRKEYPEMKFHEIAENLRAYINGKVAPIYSEAHKSFFDVFNEYIGAKSSDVSDLTIKKYRTVLTSLKEFSPNITFDKVDLKFYDKYVAYLRSRKPQGRQKTRDEGKQIGLLNDTTAKYLEVLKNFLKWSCERKYHTNNIYLDSSFKAARQPKNDIVTLRLDELKQLYEFDFSDNIRLERVRDLFCFACFTGQRWSDISAFRKEQLQGEVWRFESYKTRKVISVPLVGYAAPAIDILRKYDYKLPEITSQRFNEYIKEAATLAKLNRPVQIKRFIGKDEIITDKPLHDYISSHTGRRTAVSILLNVEKLPIHKVRDITGHADLKTLDKYLDKDEIALIESMKQTQGISKPIMKVVKKEAV